MNTGLLELIYTRRVTRYFSDAPIPEEHLWSILRAARWAPTASNLRLHSYVCVTDRTLIDQICLVSPGIAGDRPTAIIALCVDRALAAFNTIEKSNYEYIDVGTATMNILLAAHALDIGACPAILDSPRAIGALLNVPGDWTVEMMVVLGYSRVMPPEAAQWQRRNTRLEDLVQWGAFPTQSTGDASATTLRN